jgi:Protein of unknown function (DUF2905)
MGRHDTIALRARAYNAVVHVPWTLGGVGRVAIALGLGIAAVGIVLWLLDRAGVHRLPGDFVIERGRFTLVLPLATCLIVSIVLTIVLHVLGRR